MTGSGRVEIVHGKRGGARKMGGETATVLALQALSFLADDPVRLDRFLRLTGIGLDRLKADAGAVATQIAILDHLLADESLLLAFTANAGIAPDAIVAARAALAGRDKG